MATKVFVNLPVKDLDRSVAFFTKLGYTFNAQFTNEQGTCMIIGEDNFVMLLTEPFFKTFIKKDVADAFKTTEVIVSLSADSREEVAEKISVAMEAGAGKSKEPQDMGFMYQDGFEDLDGHLWEYFYMDMTAMPSAS